MAEGGDTASRVRRTQGDDSPFSVSERNLVTTDPVVRVVRASVQILLCKYCCASTAVQYSISFGRSTGHYSSNSK